MNNRPIGIFDSGIGGLSVAKRIKEVLPKETLYYFGDSARAPYGEKSINSLREYTTEITGFLKEQGVKLMVVACNTTTASCFLDIEKAADMPVIGVIKPGARNALLKTQNGIIGMLATKRTAESDAYDKEFTGKNISFHKKAISKLVPLIEQGIFAGEDIENALKSPLSSLTEKNIDTLILGCTHFPMAEETIRRLMPRVTVVDPAIETAKEIKQVLAEYDMLADTKGDDLFFVNGSAVMFKTAVKNILGYETDVIEKRFHTIVV